MICRCLQLVTNGEFCFDISQEARHLPKGAGPPSGGPGGRGGGGGAAFPWWQEASFPGESRGQAAVIGPYLLHVTLLIMSFQMHCSRSGTPRGGVCVFCSHLGTHLGGAFLLEEGTQSRPGPPVISQPLFHRVEGLTLHQHGLSCENQTR